MVFHGTEERSNVDSILRFFKNDNWSDGDYCGINPRGALLTQRSDLTRIFHEGDVCGLIIGRGSTAGKSYWQQKIPQNTIFIKSTQAGLRPRQGEKGSTRSQPRLVQLLF